MADDEERRENRADKTEELKQRMLEQERKSRRPLFKQYEEAAERISKITNQRKAKGEAWYLANAIHELPPLVEGLIRMAYELLHFHDGFSDDHLRSALKVYPRDLEKFKIPGRTPQGRDISSREYLIQLHLLSLGNVYYDATFDEWVRYVSGEHGVRGRKIIKAARMGHETVHGTEDEKKTRWAEYQSDLEIEHAKDPSQPMRVLNKAVAIKHGVSVKTIERRTKKTW